MEKRTMKCKSFTLLVLCGFAAHGVELPVVEINEVRPPFLYQPSAIGQVFTFKPDATTGRLDQQLVEQGVAAWDAANSLGLSNGLSLRGFAISNQGTSQLQASRAFLNGHADIAWRFARDAATVEQVDLIAGHDATLLGAGSPAGSLHYTSKTTHGHEFQQISTAFTSNGGIRITGDAEQHIGPIQVRGVLVSQRDERTIEGVNDNRLIGLLSMTTSLASGRLRIDTEYDQLDMPFPFGTAYAGEQFWLNHSYVDASRASADRSYQRNGIYWETGLYEGLMFSAHWQHIASRRYETLLGFYGPLNANQLSGYYRNIDENSTQDDGGVKLTGRFQVQGLRHQWAAVWQRHFQARDFSGPQSINGFQLDLASPTYPVSLDGLTLSPRVVLENYREQGIGVSDTISGEAWEVRAGVRRTQFEIDSSSSRSVEPARVAGAEHTSYSLALGLQVTPSQRTWLSQTTSFLPNRGKLADGAYLPPSLGQQRELGWAFTNETTELSLSVFDLLQTQLPGRDLNTPDAYVLIGSNHSQGIEVRTKSEAGGWGWSVNATFLNARVEDPVSATQGSCLVGIPRAYGSAQVIASVFNGGSAWITLQGSSDRPADDVNSVAAPSYAIWNLGFKHPMREINGEWGFGINNVLDRSYVRALTGVDNVWQGPRRNARVWGTWNF